MLNYYYHKWLKKFLYKLKVNKPSNMKGQILWPTEFCYKKIILYYLPCIYYFNFILWKIEIQAHKFGALNF